MTIPGVTILGTEEVEVRTLDSYMFGYNYSESIRFIKLDVEFNELDVLKGGLNTIEDHHPKILFEANEEEQLMKIAEYLQDTHQYKIIHISGYKNMYLAELK